MIGERSFIRSARPQISTSASGAAKESAVERDLTDATAADSARDGRANRRSFTSEEKLAIRWDVSSPGTASRSPARTDLPGALCSAGAPSLTEKRKQKLAPGVLSTEQSTDKTKPHPAALALHVLPWLRGMTAIDLPDAYRALAAQSIGSPSKASRGFRVRVRASGARAFNYRLCGREQVLE